MVYSSHHTKLRTVIPRLKSCLSCGNQLQFFYQFSNNIIWTLEGPIKLYRNSYACNNEACSEFRKAITPPGDSPKHHTIGFDVLLLIGLLKFDQEMISKRIVEKLRITYKLFISEQQVNNLVDKYLLLIKNQPQQQLLQQLRQRGKVIIDIDGVKPEKGNKILYLIRDLRSGAVLLARTLKFNNTDQLVELLHEIELMELDIIGLVSDKQKSIVAAVKRVFPNLPHQFCQFHYLQNISKDFEENDRSLRKTLRKRVRPIIMTVKTVKRQLKCGKITQEQFEILGKLYDRVKHVLAMTAKYPFQTVGIDLYQNIVAFEKIIKDMSKSRHIIVFNTMLKHTNSIKIQFKATYNILKEQRDHLFRITEILKSGDNSHDKIETRKQEKERLEKELLKYVEDQARLSKWKKSSKAKHQLCNWLDAVVKITRSWLPGLFGYCLEPLLPPTNNLLEQYIKEIKQSLKYLLNAKLIHRYLLRRGEYLVFGRQISQSLSKDEIEEILRKNSGEPDIEMSCRFDVLADHFRVERRCKDDFAGEMKQILKQWRSIN